MAVFREVQAGNLLLHLFRLVTPFWRTPGEHPLTEGDYATYRRHFHTVGVTAHVLTSMAYLFAHRIVVTVLGALRVRWWPPESLIVMRACEATDNLLARLPFVKSQMWLSLIEMRRPVGEVAK